MENYKVRLLPAQVEALREIAKSRATKEPWARWVWNDLVREAVGKLIQEETRVSAEVA